MKVFTTVTVIFLPLVLFAIESIQENNYGLSNNALSVQNGIFRRNRLFQQDVMENPVQMLDVYHPNLVQRDALLKRTVKKDLSWTEDKLIERNLDFLYWNSNLGNKNPVTIELGNETKMIHNWLTGKPLKVIHGYNNDDNMDDGVFAIKKAYVTVGGFNVITVDWSRAANSYKGTLAYLTVKVGQKIAKLLKNLIKHSVTEPSDIHVIGHSLGAHVSGACGAAFNPEKIGRITGLDPTRPDFENKVSTDRYLDSTDAQFVDVIHTNWGTLGYKEPIGSADFYPNGGSNQPGCFYFVCSHFRAYQLYADSVYHRNTLIAVKCLSWDDFENGVCKSNIKSPMGHDADPKAKGIFYLETNSNSPYGILDTKS